MTSSIEQTYFNKCRDTKDDSEYHQINLPNEWGRDHVFALLWEKCGLVDVDCYGYRCWISGLDGNGDGSVGM